MTANVHSRSVGSSSSKSSQPKVIALAVGIAAMVLAVFGVLAYLSTV